MTRHALAFLWVGYVIGVGACADVACRDGERKVGAVCIELSKNDAGATGNQDEEYAETAPDASSQRGGRRDASEAQTNSTRNDDAAIEEPGLSAIPAPVGSASCSEAPQCVAETPAPCTSSCGTLGTGTCTADCRFAAAELCSAPAETCNGKDDDCDGVADVNLFERSASGARVWTTASAGNATSTSVLNRPGGFWVLLRPQTKGVIELRELDAKGKPTNKVVNLERTGGLGPYLSASSGKWIAIVIAGSAFGKFTTIVQLYRAEDASFVSEFEFAGDRTNCGLITPTGLALLEDGPTVRLAVARSRTTSPTDVNGQCPIATATGSNELFFLSFAQPDGWSVPVPSGLSVPSSGFFASSMALLALPCRKEWLATYADSQNRILRRYSYAGSELARGDTLLDGIDLVSSTSTIIGRCSSGSATIAIAYSNGVVPDVRAYVRRLQMDTSSGGLSKQGTDLPLLSEPFYGAQLQHSDGKALVAGLDGKMVPHMFELTATSTKTRELSLNSFGKPDPALATADGQRAVALAASLGKRISSAQNGGAVVLSVASDGFLSGIDEHRESGDNGVSVAVTYRVGCPE